MDVGVLEIEQSQFEAYRSHDRMYVQKAARIRVCRPSELVEWNDWMLVAGYPSEKALLRPGSGGMRHVQHFTTIAGIGPAPASPLTSQDPCCSIDLWVPRDGQMQVFPHHESDVEMPAFDGVSGGGCWKTGARFKDDAYDPANPRPHLVGPHRLYPTLRGA